MTTPALKVRNLSVSFHGETGPEPVVDGISFDLYAGEIVGLVGESGCGKSVTARALMGLIPDRVAKTDYSSLSLAGTEISRLNNKGWQTIRGNEIAMVFQEPSTALDPVFTIGDQINHVLRRHLGISRTDARQKTLEALKQGGFTQAEEAYSAYPHQLSGGMKQLAMISMAMATRPRVLIADEPTTSLDVSTQSLVIDQLKQLRDTCATAILLVTHDLGVVAQSSSRVMVMYCGRLVEQSSYADLYHHPRHPYSQGLLARSGAPCVGVPGRLSFRRPLYLRRPFMQRKISADRANPAVAGCLPPPAGI
jgi:peptide/nickel transport system ATP-binding protein